MRDVSFRQVILNERGSFGRHKQSVLIELGGGLIHTLKWKDSYIAFANDKVNFFVEVLLLSLDETNS